MSFLRRAWNAVLNALGAIVGYLGMIGLEYPVSEYKFKVSDTLTRGTRLSAGDVAELVNDGFRLIVNFCAENNDDAQPSAIHGIKAVHIPVMDNQPPDLDQMIYFLTLVNEPMNQPAYCHCQAGKGRTGVAVACYRIAIQGWAADDAIIEAKRFGMAMPSQEKFLRKFAEDWSAGSIRL